MYSIDSRDRAVHLDYAPPPDPGDPLPVVLAKDGAVILSYVAGRELTVMATFPVCRAHVFGPADGHPLAKRGLTPHGAFEVQDSSWARSFGGSERVKHFVFTFGGSLFECVANDAGVELIREDDDTVKLMSRRLYK